MKWIPKFRFSLRTLFVVTTLLGVFLVPLVVRLEKARQQKEAVAWVLEHGGTVYYGGAYGEDENSSTENLMASGKNALDASGTPITAFGPPGATPNPFRPAPPPPTRAVSWIEDFLGTDFFYPVIRLELRNCDETDISPISQFSQLQSLNLGNAKIIDLSPLSELANLESINISVTNVQYLRPLANLSQLKIIDLGSSEVTDLSPLANNTMLNELSLNAKNLPKLPTPSPGSQTIDFGTPLGDEENQMVIEYDNCDVDFAPLFQLKKLKRVTLTIPDGTEVDIDQLRNGMPNCEINIRELGDGNSKSFRFLKKG